MSSYEKIYYSPPHPAAFAGAANLKRFVSKNKQPKLRQWLEGQDAYTLHKPVRRKFPRRYYNVQMVDDCWEVDLLDFRSLKTYNDGYGYVLAAIDVLSKFAWLEFLKDKSGSSVAEGFQKILNRSNGRIPIYLQSDMGREFLCQRTQNVLRKYQIMYRSSRCPDTKAAVVERFIRTIKQRLYRYFTRERTRRFVEILPKLTESYNNTRHSATRMIPASVNLENAAIARGNLRKKYETSIVFRPKYSVNDLVRISRGKRAFAKAYEGEWTLELFKIARVSQNRQPPVYFLKDLAEEDIKGYFYEHELNRVQKDLKSDVFEIDEILEEKGRGKTKQILVSWRGYPDKFNSWVNARDLQNKK